MCLVAIAIDQSRRFPLVVASNRDEYFARPSAPLDWWTPTTGGPAILSGRDLSSGGTWMGLTAQGRLALLTNLRNGLPAEGAAPSRGRIVTDWLSAREDTGDFWMRTSLSGFNGFNLIAADFGRGECFWATNASAHTRRLERGVYGLSNGSLDAPWPKVVTLKAALETSMTTADDAEDLAKRLFAALADRRIAPDAALPQTGIALERERQLSAAFIGTPDGTYGTRCSTVIIAERTSRQPITHVFERSFDSGGAVLQVRHTALRNWPPRYVEDDPSVLAEQGEVTEVEAAGMATPGATGKRKGSRPIHKPTADKRRRRGVAETA